MEITVIEIIWTLKLITFNVTVHNIQWYVTVSYVIENPAINNKAI